MSRNSRIHRISGVTAVFFLLVFLFAAGLAETTVTLSASEAKVGEVIDVSLETGKDAVSVRYLLTADGKTIFSGEDDTHFNAAFRPRIAGNYSLTVTVAYQDGSEESGTAAVSVSGKAEEEQGETIIYSQKDGWWEDKKYGKSELQKAGCAIFTLSHALQRMGWTGEDVLPEVLAKTYAGCYTKGGTANARLITRASEAYGYTTRKDLFSSKANIRDALKNGDSFSFSIVIGHIALAAGMDPGGSKARIIDSAPGATFERIKKGKIYYLEENQFREAKNPEEIPGARYYFETGEWGGLEYYMDLDYVARRGARLIRPGWLWMKTEQGRIGVVPTALGTALSTVAISGKEQEVSTAELSWRRDGSAGQLAWIRKKSGAKLLNDAGKRIATVPACTLLPVLEDPDGRIRVIWDENRGTLSPEDVELLSVSGAETGKISVNGNTSGRAKVKMRFGPSAKEKIIAEWKTGTKVAVIQKENDFFLVEAMGLRLWVQENYLTLDE